MTDLRNLQDLSDADLDEVHGGATPKLPESHTKGKIINAALPRDAATDDVIVDGNIITAENYDS